MSNAMRIVLCVLVMSTTVMGAILLSDSSDATHYTNLAGRTCYPKASLTYFFANNKMYAVCADYNDVEPGFYEKEVKK